MMIINYDAFCKEIDKGELLVGNNAEWAKEIARKVAVEIINCKDCKHRYDKEYCPMCFEEAIEWDDDGYMETDYVMHDRTQDDGYCECGER